MSLNTQQIKDAGLKYGITLDDAGAQPVMNSTMGGDPGAVEEYFRKKKQENDLLALPGQQKAALDARFAQNKQELGDYNTRYGAMVPQVINDTSSKYKLGDLLGQATGLNTRIQNVTGNLTGEGAGGFATAGQVDKAISTNYLPRFQTAVSNLQTGTALAQQEENQLLKPIQTEGELLTDRLAREATGYDNNQQRELDSLLAQLQANTTLTSEQMRRATALAQMENDYKIAKENASSKASTGERYVSIADGAQLYDTQTGRIIENTKNFKGSSGGGETFT